MKPTDYPANFEIEGHKLSDGLIEILGERVAVIGYEFEEGDKHWGERDSLTASLFGKAKDGEIECLDHLLDESEQAEIEGFAREHLEAEILQHNAMIGGY